MTSQLGDLLARAAAGCPPPPDGGLTVLPQPSPRDAGVISFTAHAVVFADVPAGWVRAHLPAGDLAAPVLPPFLVALAERLGRRVGSHDLLTVAASLPGPPPMRLTEAGGPARAPGPARVAGVARAPGPARAPVPAGAPVPARAQGAGHPRVQRARRYRDDVSVWNGDGAVVILGRGVAGRREVAVEVDPERRGKGLGRRAALAARHLVPPGEPLWAQIAPGNAASVRAFLAAGFVPVGAEVLLVET